MKIVVFIDNSFGYQNGGCSTINFELCIALRQITDDNSVKIISLVINCSREDRLAELENKAMDLGIEVIHKNIISDEGQLSQTECKDIRLSILHNIENDIDNTEIIWIGHDIFTGEYAIRLAEDGNEKSAVCIHTDYDTIEGLKGVNREGIIKENRQRQIIQKTNYVFAIGPRLLERVREVRVQNVYQLIPGMTIHRGPDLFNERAIITYGRFEGNVAQVKQVYLALAAFGRAVAIMNNNKDYILHIIGMPKDEKKEEQLRKIAEEYAYGRKLSINFLEYTQDREKLYSILKNNCAGLMISISEGFGLTGWEIISAGIPLVLTKKSGLYDFLDERFEYMLNGLCLPVDLKGSSIDNLSEEDVQTVAEKIVTVFKQPQKTRNAASVLREELKEETWHKAAGNIASAIGLSYKKYGTADIYSDTYKARKYSIEEILNALEIGEIGKRYVVFFGGISKMLCEDRAISKITRWLKYDSSRKLFICYETGKAANQRAEEIDGTTITEKDGLSKEPGQRMKEKEELVEKSFYKYSEDIRSQITFLKLENSPMVYSIIVDSDIYITILLQTRSSESMTMKISREFMAEREKIIESMQFIIKKQSIGDAEKKLLEVLNDYKEHYL